MRDAIAHRTNENELTRSVRDAGLGERGHPCMTGERGSQQRHGERSAGSLAEPQPKVEERLEPKLAQQHPMRCFRRDVRRHGMIERVRAQLCQWRHCRRADEAVE